MKEVKCLYLNKANHNAAIILLQVFLSIPTAGIIVDTGQKLDYIYSYPISLAMLLSVIGFAEWIRFLIRNSAICVSDSEICFTNLSKKQIAKWNEVKNVEIIEQSHKNYIQRKIIIERNSSKPIEIALAGWGQTDEEVTDFIKELESLSPVGILLRESYT